MQQTKHLRKLTHRLRLRNSPQLQEPVLLLAALLARSRGCLGHSSAAQAVGRLKLLCFCQAIVDDAKTSALSASKVRPEPKEKDRRRIRHLVHLRQLLSQFRLRHICPARVEDIDDKLLARKESVREELPCPDGRHDDESRAGNECVPRPRTSSSA
jgi:hypothetical protein